MTTDTNWRVRKQAAVFLYDYLQPLHQMRKGSKSLQPGQSQAKLAPVQDNSVQKVTKQRFKSHFYDIMAELATDEEVLV